MLEKVSRGIHTKNLAVSQSSIKAISTVRPAENECVFGRLRTILEVSGFVELQHVKADSHVSGNLIRAKRKWTICC